MSLRVKIIIFLILGIIGGSLYFLIPKEEKSDQLDKKVVLNGIKYREKRNDGAMRVTDCYPKSCQNPVFSPDGHEILFTRFLGGYNQGASELVRINLQTDKEQIVVSAKDSNNVNVPYGSWIGDHILWASDRAGGTEEIYTANSDGSEMRQLTSHSVAEGYYIEPVFNPQNINKILFEYVFNDKKPHRLAVLESDKEGAITYLTSDVQYDDRLPSWSPDGQRIIWQRSAIGQDNWKIFVADIIMELVPRLANVREVSLGPDDTDNSWAGDNQHILSSRTGDGKIPNIFVVALSGEAVRITKSDKEDGAPTHSPDKNLIAFESNHDLDENSPTDIWVIDKVIGNNSKIDWKKIKTYANTYIVYTRADLDKLKKFDIVMIEPYNVPDKEFLRELKKAGTVVMAYISVGEADDERRYWKSWQPTDRAYEINSIPRTKVDKNNKMFIGPDPGWPGSYFVDASNENWQRIILNEEIPYIMALGDNLYDGIVMDLIDVVDEYEGRSREQAMRQGMIDLIRKIKEKYSNLLVIPNRGFGILEEMGPYIDGFKFEELTLKYNNTPGGKDYGRYKTQFTAENIHENQEQIDQVVAFARKYSKPIFALDHVETEPPNNKSAKLGYEEAQKLSQKYDVQFIWYANSIDQDLPVWNF